MQLPTPVMAFKNALIISHSQHINHYIKTYAGSWAACRRFTRGFFPLQTAQVELKGSQLFYICSNCKELKKKKDQREIKVEFRVWSEASQEKGKQCGNFVLEHFLASAFGARVCALFSFHASHS